MAFIFDSHFPSEDNLTSGDIGVIQCIFRYMQPGTGGGIQSPGVIALHLVMMKKEDL